MKIVEEKLRWIPLRLYSLSTLKEGADLIGEEAKNNILIELKTKIEELAGEGDKEDSLKSEIEEMIEYVRKRIIY